MIARGHVMEDPLRDGLVAIEPSLIRYPSLDAATLRDALDAFLSGLRTEEEPT